MNDKDNPTSSGSYSGRYAVPPPSLPDDERVLIEADPFAFVVGMKDAGARDAEITNKLRLAEVPQPEIAELMERGSQFLKENRFDLGKGRVKSGLILLGVGVAAMVAGFVTGFVLVLWGGGVSVLVGVAQTVRGVYQMLSSKREAKARTE